MDKININFGLTAQDYAAHRAGFPLSIFPRLERFGVGKLGQRILDLGTGTGTLARGFAQQGAQVIGLDIAIPMMLQAREKDHIEGVHTEYLAAGAEWLPFPAHSMDVITAGQCWHWFDPVCIYNEAKRVLMREGWLVIAHFDWLPLEENVVARTEELILKFNPDWMMGGGDGFYPKWMPGLHAARFKHIETFSYDVDVPYTPAAWRGRIRASAGVGASLSLDKMAEFDVEHAALLAADFRGEILDIPHRVFVIVARG